MTTDKPLDGSDVTDPELRRQVVEARQFVVSLDELRDALADYQPPRSDRPL